MKDKKPALPPRRPKKKVVRAPTPEPPKEDPPEEPLPQSPRILQLPIEASVPPQESAPINMPLPMRLPEEPPSEPIAYIMPNLFCPVDPDTPYNFEIEPREEEQHIAPLEPLPLRILLEPEPPAYPERMIKMSTEDIMSEKLDEPDLIRRPSEPCHDDEPMMDYPQQERPLFLPPAQPDSNEPYILDEAHESLDSEAPLKYADPRMHYLTPDDVLRTHEMSI